MTSKKWEVMVLIFEITEAESGGAEQLFATNAKV
jgi:hypothetical protein